MFSNSIVFEKLTRAYFFQIALETILLPILINYCYVNTVSVKNKPLINNPLGVPLRVGLFTILKYFRPLPKSVESGTPRNILVNLLLQ